MTRSWPAWKKRMREERKPREECGVFGVWSPEKRDLASLVYCGLFALGLATKEEMDTILDLARRINAFLKDFWAGCGVTLVDFKIEFGRLADGTIILADEISPDTCRLWDAATGEKLDKDRFRRDLGGVEEAYAEIMGRLEAADRG